MPTKIERIDAKIAEARKALDKATTKRDESIKHLAMAADRIKTEQRSLARLERQKQELRAAERNERKRRSTTPAEDSPTISAL